MRIVQARVSAVAAGGRISVIREGRTETESVPCDRAVALAAVVGDIVLIALEDARPWAIALLGVGSVEAPSDAQTDPETPESGRTIRGTDSCPPVWSGTWRNGAWLAGSQLTQGDWGYGLSKGGAWLGRKPTALGTLAAGRIGIRREKGGVFASQAPLMALLPGTARPATFPAAVATATGPSLAIGAAATWQTPPAWLALIEGGACGIGIVGTSPYWRGTITDAAFDWERTT